MRTNRSKLGPVKAVQFRLSPEAQTALNKIIIREVKKPHPRSKNEIASEAIILAEKMTQPKTRKR